MAAWPLTWGSTAAPHPSPLTWGSMAAPHTSHLTWGSMAVPHPSSLTPHLGLHGGRCCRVSQCSGTYEPAKYLPGEGAGGGREGKHESWHASAGQVPVPSPPPTPPTHPATHPHSGSCLGVLPPLPPWCRCVLYPGFLRFLHQLSALCPMTVDLTMLNCI